MRFPQIIAPVWGYSLYSPEIGLDRHRLVVVKQLSDAPRHASSSGVSKVRRVSISHSAQRLSSGK